MTSPSEAQFQRTVTEAAERHGWRWCHIRKATVRKGRIATPTSVPGWPDLVLWRPGKGGLLFVELKKEGGQLSPEQRDVLASLKSAGAFVDTWFPHDWDRILPLLQNGPSTSDSPAGDGVLLSLAGDPSSPPRGPHAETGSVGSHPRGGEPDWKRIAVQVARYGGSYHGLSTAERDTLEAEVAGENEREWGVAYERTEEGR